MNAFNISLPLSVLMWVLTILLSGCAGQELQKQQLQEQKNLSENLQNLQTLVQGQAQVLQDLNNNLQKVEGHVGQLSYEVDELQYITASLQEKLPAPLAPRKAAENNNVSKVAKPTTLARDKITLGRVEWVWVDLLNQYLKSRVDTGAKSSSIHATDLQYFERDGEDWVKFKLHTHEKTASEDQQATVYEAPLVRKVKIKQASSEGYEKRAVIKLKFKLGDIMDEAEFTLTDRANMIYPLLIGRNVLRDVALVDVSKAFTQKRKK